MGPSSQAAHSMTCDSSPKKVILFGGADTTGNIFNDTCEWDGTEWTQVADTGPTPRAFHRMVYDSDNNRSVLFGGRDNPTSLNDTWEWDGTEWTQVVDTGPSLRAYHSMTYDSNEKCIVLFGGYDVFSTPPITFADTWKYKSHIWTKASEMGPPPTALTDMTHTGKRAIFFGGSNELGTSVGLNNNTWDWNGSLWVQRQNMGPTGRAGHSMVYDDDRNVEVLFGGIDNTSILLGDTWELKVRVKT